MYLGKRSGKRLSKLQIDTFAATFKPVFRDYEITKDRNGSMELVLYLNEKDTPVLTKSIISEWIPMELDIKNELGIQFIE